MDYAVNPIVNQTNNLVQGIGRIAHQQGITSEHIQRLKQMALKPVTNIKGSLSKTTTA
jgi:hypothetical protein